MLQAQSLLNTSKLRLSLLPDAPRLLDSIRVISEVQNTLKCYSSSIAFQPDLEAPGSRSSLPTAVHGIHSKQSEEWENAYLEVLTTQNLEQLRELLARSNPDIIMPLHDAGVGSGETIITHSDSDAFTISHAGFLSQTIILTLVHRVSPFDPFPHAAGPYR